MLYDFLMLEERVQTPLYQQLYQNIRKAVEDGRLKKGEKLPSIRRLSEDLRLSRTTVETAYQQLCVEGYVKSRPQSGYYVAASGGSLPRSKEPRAPGGGVPANAPHVQFSFDSAYVDSENVDIKIWRRHIRDVLNRQEALASYGASQGEPSLREALSAYSHGVRGVVAPPERIVIGAGTQPLLYLLCGLLQEKRVAMTEPGFLQAERVFADCGVEVVRLPSDGDGIRVDALEASGVRVALVSPSQGVAAGDAMPVSRRMELLAWARRGGLLIEDDYSGELRYRARPVPAMQGLSGGDHVVYLGSFSKLLLPSIRIGYMALPPEISRLYRGRAESYNQTASKIEQLALCAYIRNGQLERRLRRLRKLYAAKSAALTGGLRTAFGARLSVSLQETALCLLITPLNGTPAGDLIRLAAAHEIFIPAARADDQLRLSFAGIPLRDIPPAVEALRRAWEERLSL